jgi:hypothetical protein
MAYLAIAISLASIALNVLTWRMRRATERLRRERDTE